MKVLNSLSGAGQMMFTKYLIVVDGNINIRNYKELASRFFANVDFSMDLIFSRGPLDVLDHSSDNFSFGGKVGVDATIKYIEESSGRNKITQPYNHDISKIKCDYFDRNIIINYNISLLGDNIPILIISVNRSEDPDIIAKVKGIFLKIDPNKIFRLIIVVDHTVDVNDLFMVTWQLLANSDPQRDHQFISPFTVLIDGTIKAYREGGFPRKWPNVVCSDIETISTIDRKWESLGLGELLHSPSLKYISLCRKGIDEIIID
jgi:4-hydroxy-3-polyprenylbenzoate decarboxylase